MGKKVILSFSEGDFDQGFTAFLRIQDDAGVISLEKWGKLPPSEEIESHLQQWRTEFGSMVSRQLSMRGRPGEVLRVSGDSAQRLAGSFNHWLNTEDPQWRGIRDSLLHELSPDDEICLTIQTGDMGLRLLPWQVWKLIADQFTRAEIALSPVQAKKPKLIHPETRCSKVRILAVLGQSHDIDTEFDQKVLQSLPAYQAEVIFLNHPTKKELSNRLWQSAQGWDIFFFAGHSGTDFDGAIGWISLNPEERMEIKELKNGMKNAISSGLQLAIFNSCDGLGLANQLSELDLPQSIVMREPVPDRVAQDFLQHFLGHFSGGCSLYTSVRRARERIEDDYNKEYPGIGWLITICQNPMTVPPIWGESGLEIPAVILGNEPVKLGSNPYKGLDTFQERDSDYFFGREKAIHEILEKFYYMAKCSKKTLSVPRFLTIHGPSGSGKSSIARAGLLPRLRSEGYRVEIFSPEHDRPFQKLAAALARAVTGDSAPVEKSAEFERVIRQANESGGYDGLLHVAEFLPENTRLILLIDQFEELFTRNSDKKTQEQFIKNLLNAATSNSGRISVIITLRSDFIGQVQHFPGLISDATAYLLVAMNDEELAEAIVKPAELASQPKDKQPFTPELVKLLVSETRSHEGALPLLEFALENLWNQLTDPENIDSPAELLNKLGGVGGALANEAESTYRSFEYQDEEKAIVVKRALLRLVLTNGENVHSRRRKVPLSEIIPDKSQYEQFHAALDRFSQSRLLTFGSDETTGETTVEITHETLFENWERLKGWLEKSVKERKFYQRLTEASREWKEENYSSAFLWNKAQLERLKSFEQNNDSFLQPNAPEKEFVEASRRKDKAGLTQKLLMAAMVPLLILLVAAWYWDGFYRTHVSTCAKIKWHHGILEEIGQPNEQKESFYKVYRRGRYGKAFQTEKINKQNTVEELTKYDKWGNEIESLSIVHKDELANNTDGWKKRTKQYDESGNINEIETLFIDNKGNLVNHTDGWAKKTEKRDESGNTNEIAWYDKRNKLAPDKNGVAKWINHYELDEKVETSYYDKNGDLMPNFKPKIVVVKVKPGSQASKIGIKPDDIVIKLNSKSVDSTQKFIHDLKNLDKKGSITIQRGNDEIKFEVLPGKSLGVRLTWYE